MKRYEKKYDHKSYVFALWYFIFIVAVTVSFYGYGFWELKVPIKQYSEIAIVEIPLGANLAATIDIFKKQGLIRSPYVFKGAAKFLKVDRKLKPGRYAFQGRVTQWDVLMALRRGPGMSGL